MIYSSFYINVFNSQGQQMSGTSIQIEDRKLIFQVFCGRWEEANVLDHQGLVLKRMLNFKWNELKQVLGLTHIYLLGLWDTTGPILVDEEQGIDLRSHENRCPSPFAITHHTQVSPLLGTNEDLTSLIRCLHDNQLEVLVDFVPNHTGTTHPWVGDHPEFYKWDETGNPRHAFSGDVIELDYSKPKVYDEMRSVVQTLFEEFPIDGIRCDMAHLIPTDFWHEVIHLIKKQNPNAIFIAEAYSDSVFDLSPQYALLDAGFTAIYDEPLFRNMKIYGSQLIRPLFGHIEYELAQHDHRWVHYVSNHDDILGFQSDPVWVYQQLLLLLEGWQLIYNGTMWGFEGRLSHHWVQVLPKKFYNVAHLPVSRAQWLHWYTQEQPRMIAAHVLSDKTAEIVWKGNITQGVQGYTFI